MKKMDKPPRSKILIVDDDLINIRVLEIPLRAQGYTVLKATSGQEALEQIEVSEPDLILLDIQMPQMDGFEVCRRIRENEETQFVPIVMVTALKEAEDRIKSIEVGADDFISKPVDYHEVLARVGSLLRIKQYRDDLKHANEELAIHNARLEKELQMAKEIQQILIPQKRDLAGFRFFAHYVPEIDVGGDFFDLWEIGSGKLGVFISDVMGHGVSAAFVTVFIKTVVEEIRGGINDPGELLAMLNTRFDRLISSQLFMFATAFCAIIDLSKNTLSCANAGHPFPFLLKHHQGICEPIGDKDAGKGLGLAPNSVYKTHQYPFDDLSRVFLYTDGVYEIKNRGGEEFNRDRLKSVLLQQVTEPTPSLVDNVLAAINQFSDGAEKDDDMTLVAVDVDKSSS
jgi:sigma-B regulation protein RsbU (phosphoserine phosphatase)